MKKVSVLGMAVIALSIFMSGCAKEDPASPVELDLTKNVATVKGIAHATLDATKMDKPQYAPSGTKVFLKVPYSDITGGIAEGEYLMTATIGQSGTFTFENVPVSSSGTTVTIVGDGFESDYDDGDDEKNHSFECGEVLKTLQIGSTAYVTLEYGSGTLFE